MIDDEPGARFLLHDPSDRPRGLHPLVRIEIGGRLVDQIDVRIPAETQGDGDALQLAAGQRRDVPLQHSFDLERLEDLRLEVTGIRLLSDGVAKQFADRAFVDGLEVLRLVRDLPPPFHGTRRGRLLAREHLDERRLAGRIRSDNADDLAFSQPSRMDGELEALEPFRESVERDERLALPVASRRAGVEANLAISETDVLLLQVAAEIHVDRGADRPRLRDDPVRTLLAVHQEDRVCEEIKDGQVVLYHDDVLLFRERLDDLRDLESLVDRETG